jgi:hypothetical protein
MASREKRVQVGIRLSALTAEQLKKASYLMKKTQSEVVSEALEEYYERHRISSVYELHVTDSFFTLIQTVEDRPQIVEITVRNGVSPEDVASNYGKQLGHAVSLVYTQTDKLSNTLSQGTGPKS